MTTVAQKTSDGTIELTITIPWDTVKQTYRQVIDELVLEAEVPGFRKGKAPKNLVEEKLDKTKVYEDVIRHMIPKVYGDAITSQNLHPVVTPKIELKEASEGKDWVVRALTCEKPTVTLGDYKKEVTTLKTAKQTKLWVPGKDPKQDDQKATKPTLDELLTAVVGTITTTLPGLLIEHEVNRLLSDLIDQTKKLGLTVEQYLASTSRTSASLRGEYEKQAKHTLVLEFGLEAIADKEGILVSDDDIDRVVQSAKTDEERKALGSQRYYIASVLRRQKTLDFLASL